MGSRSLLLLLLLIYFRLIGGYGSYPDLDISLSKTRSTSGQDVQESTDFLDFVQDELDDLSMDLTRSFIAQHSRRKREILRYSYEARLNGKMDSFETRTDASGYSCLYKNQTYLVQSDGIYRLEGLLDSPHVDEPSKPTLIKVTPWTFGRGERVLKTYEWDGILFLVTANEDGSFSKVYTVHGHSYVLTPRQEIRNQGYATAAYFFVHSYDLYLIITTDNKAHSLTISPIYRWSRTYMDQIHEIQTRGAVGVVAFPVSSYTYVAIAQAEDAAGNYEVGTLVVRVYGKGELEKVQLLWSVQPVSVSYVRFLEEHFLVIGQKKESSICYWFGGYQFVYWQSLDGLQGNSVFLDSFVLPDREPLLLTSTESAVSLYTRTNNPHQRDTSLLNRTSVVYTTSGSSERILDARFLQRVPTSSAPFLHLALTLQSSLNRLTLKVLPLSLEKVPLGEDRVDPEDKVSRCMSSLREALDADEPLLSQLDASQGSILTKNGDWKFQGSLISKASLTLSPSVSVIVGSVNPILESPEDLYNYPPSATLEKTEIALEEFREFLETQLRSVLLKSQPGNISGHFSFEKGLWIRNLDSYVPIYLETLNGISWTSLEAGILRTPLPKPQFLSGDWEIGNLKTEEIETGSRIGNASINDFLLTSSTIGQRKELLKGPLTFEKNVEMENLQLGPYATLNGIPISEISFRGDKYGEIRGYKHGERVNGGTGLDLDLINGIKLSSWYDGILKMEGVEEETSTGLKTFGGDLTIAALMLDKLNGKDWKDFVGSALINGQDQTLYSDLSCGKLKVETLQVETINGVTVDDWMTISTPQEVRSEIIIAGELKVRGNLETESINAIRLSDGVRRTETNVRISGPLELSSFTLGNLTCDPSTTLNGLHIPSAAKLRKKHIYDTQNGQGLILDGNVEGRELESQSLNEVPFQSLRDSYWSSNVNNQIPAHFNFGSAKVQVEGEFLTGTLNSVQPETEFVQTSGKGVIRRNLQFSSDVVVKGPLAMANGAAINSYDISEVEKDIIRTTDGKRMIRGRKTFEDWIEAKGGVRLKEVNGVTLERELIFLEGHGTQELRGKKFKDVVSHKVESEVDVGVKGTVNLEDLEEIRKTTMYEDQENFKIRGDVTFEKSIRAESLTVLDEINGLKFGEIVGNVIGLDREEELTTPLIFADGNLKFLESAQVSAINGINPQEYLAKVVSRKADLEWTAGDKEFGHVVVDGDLTCHLLNSVNLRELEASAFSKTSNQFISGKFAFQELQSRGNLITTTLSGVPVSSFLRTDRAGEVVEGDILFKGKSTEVGGQILLDGLLNNYRIEEVAEGLAKLVGNRKFAQVWVTGNLSWENSDLSLRRLSHLFKNAVTIGGDQTINGKVTFERGLEVAALVTDQWINGVDLAFILSDSVQWNSPVEFTGLVTFEQGLSVGRGGVTVEGLNTLKVNNITLKELVQEVVTINTPRRIYGTKSFARGLATHKLNIHGTIDNIHPKDLVTYGDERHIDKVIMSHVSISKNLDYKKLNGYELEELLQKRITLDKDHRISSDWTFHQDLIIQNCEAYSINGFRLGDIFHRNASHLQRVTGTKTLRNLVVDGSLEDVTINEIRLDQVGKEVLGLERDEVIQRHVTFMDTVHLAGGTEVTGVVNEYAIDAVAEAFTSSLDALVQNVLVSPETKDRTTALILELEKTQELKAVWLDFLEVRKWFGKAARHPTTRVETFVHPEEEGKLTFAFHGPTLETGGTLPAGCACNSIQFFHFDEKAKVLGSVDCVNIFDLTEGDVSYTVYSHVVSYNKTCSRKETGETYISISPGPDERYNMQHGGSLAKPDWSVGRLEKSGFISDVKSFSVGSKSYLVIAQSYDPYAGTHRAEVIVYDTTYETLVKVQEIQAHGARRLALDVVHGIWILLVGNGGEVQDDVERCPTSSTIHQWLPVAGQFSLLRDVATEELVDVALVPVEREGYFHEAYAAFAQNQPDGGPFGNVAIYKYQGNNFVYFQSLEVAGRVGGLERFSVAQFSYLILAIPSSGLHFYHYGHVEGFKLRLVVPLKGANDLGVLVRRGEVFFPVALEDKDVGGVLTEGIFQGRLN